MRASRGCVVLGTQAWTVMRFWAGNQVRHRVGICCGTATFARPALVTGTLRRAAPMSDRHGPGAVHWRRSEDVPANSQGRPGGRHKGWLLGGGTTVASFSRLVISS